VALRAARRHRLADRGHRASDPKGDRAEPARPGHRRRDPRRVGRGRGRGDRRRRSVDPSAAAGPVAGRGLPAAGPALTVVTATAEASALICSGPRHDGEHTHALLAERAPAARRLDRPAALAELALRYITGHGPATDRDLAYWASLTLGDARAGLDAVRGELSTFVSDDRTYWYLRDTEPASFEGGSAHLLQILDEIYRGYQDSRWALDADARLGRGREPSAGMALLDGQVAATMNRRVAATVTFELRPLRPITPREHGALAAVADRYGAFLERPARLVIRS
jgi:hypothetical protein